MPLPHHASYPPQCLQAQALLGEAQCTLRAARLDAAVQPCCVLGPELVGLLHGQPPTALLAALLLPALISNALGLEHVRASGIASPVLECLDEAMLILRAARDAGMNAQ